MAAATGDSCWGCGGNAATVLNWSGCGKLAAGIGGWKACGGGKTAGGPGVGIRPFPAPGPESNPRFAPMLGCSFPRGVAFAPVAIF